MNMPNTDKLIEWMKKRSAASNELARASEKEIETLKKQLAEVKKCEWGNLGDGEYETSCNDSFIFGEGTPKRNGFIHCPKCGGLIVAYKNNSKKITKEHKQ